jgi:hypothetical protein
VPVPDLFAFSLLDADGNPAGATDPESGALLTINLDGREPTVTNFGVSITTVPEPGTLHVAEPRARGGNGPRRPPTPERASLLTRSREKC